MLLTLLKLPAPPRPFQGMTDVLADEAPRMEACRTLALTLPAWAVQDQTLVVADLPGALERLTLEVLPRNSAADHLGPEITPPPSGALQLPSLASLEGLTRLTLRTPRLDIVLDSLRSLPPSLRALDIAVTGRGERTGLEDAALDLDALLGALKDAGAHATLRDLRVEAPFIRCSAGSSSSTPGSACPSSCGLAAFASLRAVKIASGWESLGHAFLRVAPPPCLRHIHLDLRVHPEDGPGACLAADTGGGVFSSPSVRTLTVHMTPATRSRKALPASLCDLPLQLAQGLPSLRVLDVFVLQKGPGVNMPWGGPANPKAQLQRLILRPASKIAEARYEVALKKRSVVLDLAWKGRYKPEVKDTHVNYADGGSSGPRLARTRSLGDLSSRAESEGAAGSLPGGTGPDVPVTGRRPRHPLGVLGSLSSMVGFAFASNLLATRSAHLATEGLSLLAPALVSAPSVIGPVIHIALLLNLYRRVRPVPALQ